MTEPRVDLTEFEGAELKALAVIVVLINRLLPDTQDAAISLLAEVVSAFETLPDLQAFIAALDLLAAHPSRQRLAAYLNQADALVAIGHQVM